MSTIDLGKIRMDWKGEYDETSPQILTKGDVIRYQGNVYTVVAEDPWFPAIDGWDDAKVDLMINGQIPVTNRGDVLTVDATNTPSVLPLGDSGKVLISDGSDLVYSKNKIINGKHLINRVEYPYTAGQYTVTTSEQWFTGLYVDYTPLSSTSKINLHLEFSISGISTGGITHAQVFKGADNGYGTAAEGNYAFSHRMGLSATNCEQRVTMNIPVDSWGAGVEGRTGLYGRTYNSSWYASIHGTMFWNATAASYFCPPVVYIEEWEEEA
jgi:signal peptidase I